MERVKTINSIGVRLPGCLAVASKQREFDDKCFILKHLSPEWGIGGDAIPSIKEDKSVMDGAPGGFVS